MPQLKAFLHVQPGYRKGLLNRPSSVYRHMQDLRGVPRAVQGSVSQVGSVVLKDGITTCGPILNGCWQLAGGHGSEVFSNLPDTLAAHAAAGLTTFDTADIYGPSERYLGGFQADRIKAGLPPVQIFTKFVPNIMRARPTRSSIEQAIQRSLQNLQVPSLDMVQLHWWDYGVDGMVDTGLVLADLQARGLIKAIGVTNMDCNALAKLVDAGVPVVSNQVQFSLLDRRPLNGMLQYCRQHNIHLFTYGSLGGGLLTDRYYEEPKKTLLGQSKYSPIDLNTSSLGMYWNVVKLFGGSGGQEPWRALLKVLKGVATKHSCTIANVALRWVIQQGGPEGLVHPIIGLRGSSHIADNLRALNVTLDGDDLAAIQSVLDTAAGPSGDIYSFERR